MIRKVLAAAVVAAGAVQAAAHGIDTGLINHTMRAIVSTASADATTLSVTVHVDPTPLLRYAGWPTYDVTFHPPVGGVATSAAAASGVASGVSTSFTFTVPRPAGDHEERIETGAMTVTLHTSVDSEDDEPQKRHLGFEVVARSDR